MSYSSVNKKYYRDFWVSRLQNWLWVVYGYDTVIGYDPKVAIDISQAVDNLNRNIFKDLWTHGTDATKQISELKRTELRVIPIRITCQHFTQFKYILKYEICKIYFDFVPGKLFLVFYL
jgi:hypothetical protein